MEPDEYYTIESESEGLYKEKGSRFLAFAYPVYSSDDIKSVLARIEKKFHDARHRCYAWKLGLADDNFRQNDDGEPSGTAGRPIYGQILSCGLTNILVVVVRYFGGVKLGTGGLAVAYKTATSDALANAAIIKRHVTNVYDVKFQYRCMNDVMKIVKDASLDVLEQQFDLDCRIRIAVRSSSAANVVDKLGDIDGTECEFISER